MSGRNSIIHYSRMWAIIVLAVLFGWSGFSKLLNPEGFALAVYRFHLLPYFTVNITALWITMLELWCAVIVLFFPRYRCAALLIVLFLLALFSIGISVNLARGSHMACGCFSTSPLARSLGWWGLLRNLVLMALATYALRSYRLGEIK